MPASKTYYSAADVARILGVGKNTSYEILHSFDARGQLFKFGKTLRVRADYFDKWLLEREQPDPRNQLAIRYAASRRA